MKLLTSIKHKFTSFFTYIWTHKKSPKVFIPTIIAVIGLFMVFSSNADTSTYAVQSVEAKEFVQEVSVTGKVVPAQKVDMSFEVSGRISKVNVAVGEKVKAGQVLASLNNADYYATLQKNQATYVGEQAKLSDLVKGNRTEEVAIAASEYQIALQNIDQAKAKAIEEIKDSFSIADDAVSNKADQFFKYARTVSPELTFFVSGNTTLKGSLERQRIVITENYDDWQALVAYITPETLSDSNIQKAKGYMVTIQKFLVDLNTALADATFDRTDSTFQTNKTGVTTARSNINTSIQDIDSALTALKNANSNAISKADSLKLMQSGNTSETIAVQKANAQGAAAGVSSASASLNKTLIRAPFVGIVTRVQYRVGESVSQADPVITIMSDSAYEIETFVSETDAAKFKKGQPAKVTLDALGDAVVFDAAISEIDLSETIKDGVVSYKVRLQFTTKDERIRSGLTANVVAETDRRQNVIKVPQTAIVISKGKKNVKIVSAGTTAWSEDIDKQAKLVPVVTGSIDREGDIEIASGLESGQIIIIRAPKSDEDEAAL